MININNFAFQGINGAYSELAGVKIFPKAKSLACPTFEEMFQSVRDGKAEVAMVPIENSQAGRVALTFATKGCGPGVDNQLKTLATLIFAYKLEFSCRGTYRRAS